MEIGDFVGSLPVVNFETAAKIYREAKSVESFQRAEIAAAFGSIDAGVKMGFVIGKGPLNYNDREPNAIYFIPYFVEARFGREARDSRDIERVEISKITQIRLLDLIA